MIKSSWTSALKLRVMTYNIRFDNPEDEKIGCGWSTRRGRVTALIRDTAPDVIGLQEVLAHQLDQIAHDIDGFAWFGVGRDDGRNAGEFAPIFYRKDRFTPLSSETFWLSETPDVPGSRSWGASHRRIVTKLSLQDRQSGIKFNVMNTHFDHISALAREQSALLLKQKVREAGDVPTVIMGDFNCQPQDSPWRKLVYDDGTMLRDVMENGPHAPTYRDFVIQNPRHPHCVIDSVFLTRQWNLRGCKLVETQDGRTYPSDHVPVVAEVSL